MRPGKSLLPAPASNQILSHKENHISNNIQIAQFRQKINKYPDIDNYSGIGG